MPLDVQALLAAARVGDRRALARLISQVESDGPGAAPALADVFPAGGRAHVVGITGAPGAGKSTLTDGLIRCARRAGSPIAVLAVDPSSPFSGGAILGDRIRMQDHIGDDGVYVRSMASRGHLGGLSAAAPKAVALLDGVGFPFVIVETVGVGQAEVEIASQADTTVVVVTPGWGDGIQAAKAGLLETGDVFVVNKADRPGVDATVRDLDQMLDMGPRGGWRPPVLATVAVGDEGVPGVWEALADHMGHLRESGELESGRAERLEGLLEGALADIARRRARAFADGERYREIAGAVTARQIDPWSAADRLLAAATTGPRHEHT